MCMLTEVCCVCCVRCVRVRLGFYLVIYGVTSSHDVHITQHGFDDWMLTQAEASNSMPNCGCFPVNHT